MSSLDRAAFQARAERKATELDDGRHPPGSSAVGTLILAVIAWFFWPPLAAALVIIAIGHVRELVLRHGTDWNPTTAITAGALYGIGLASTVRLAAFLTAAHPTVTAGLAALGLVVAGYIGYGVARDEVTWMQGDARRVEAQVAAISTYIVAVVALFVLPRS